MHIIKIIQNEISTSITVKGSKFIGYAIPITNKSEIDEYLNQLRKEHYKATHVCYAYRIGKQNLTEFGADAGEPSGTAGKPILGAIHKYELREILVAVVRYFGGSKLGIRGLIDAYSQAATNTLQQAHKIHLAKYQLCSFIVDYQNIASIEYQLRQQAAQLMDSKYEEQVYLQVAFPSEHWQSLQNWLDDKTGQDVIKNLQILDQDWLELSEKISDK
jgi:uncharacterized YigZ family protein